TEPAHDETRTPNVAYPTTTAILCVVSCASDTEARATLPMRTRWRFRRVRALDSARNSNGAPPSVFANPEEAEPCMQTTVKEGLRMLRHHLAGLGRDVFPRGFTWPCHGFNRRRPSPGPKDAGRRGHNPQIYSLF
ncbi:hypothetical protein TSAR_015988, partial [Trichomalopsis sarcophagae]